MVGAGYSEIYSFDFLGLDHLARLGLPEADRRRVPVRVRNPLNDEQAVLRTTLLPGLLDGLRINAARNQGDAALFEIGSVFFPNPGAPIPDQPLHLAFAAMGSRSGAPWQPRAGRDALDATGLVEALSTATGVPVRIEQEEAPELHPGRGARVFAGDVVLGVVGELRPDVAAAWDLTGRVIVGELSLAVWPDPVSSPFVVPSVFPPVVFDLAFDLAERTPASKVLGAIAAAGWPYLEQQVVFDVFTGSPLQPGRMSLAVRLTFRHPDRTMVDKEMVPIRAAIVAAVADATGGILRGG
jgi:phenylalanyl-tRNA synthetase beta chain